MRSPDLIDIYGIDLCKNHALYDPIKLINKWLHPKNQIDQIVSKCDKYFMTIKVADDFFNNINFVSIVSTIQGLYASDGAMSVLLDFERVLDDADLYAYKNWLIGELVQGPNIDKYTVSCTFMWPYKLMPDPRGVKRLIILGCNVKFGHSRIKVPVQVNNADDFVPGTNYPKMIKRKVWFVNIEIPLALMDEIKEGSIDLAGKEIDLKELDEAYNEDLDKADVTDQTPTAAEPDNLGFGAAPVQGGLI